MALLSSLYSKTTSCECGKSAGLDLMDAFECFQHHFQPFTSLGSLRLVEPVRKRCRSWSPSTAARHRVWCLAW